VTSSKGRPKFSSDDLLTAAKQHYRSKEWTVPATLSTSEENFAGKLAVRFGFLAKHDGMEHLVYVTGKITDATYKLHKQVLFDIESTREFCHVVLVCDEKISKKDENKLKEMGLGVLLIRRDAAPLMLIQPRLRCFHEPSTYDRVPSGIRKKVKGAVTKIVDGDVCVGVLDLAQILENRLQNPAITAKALGGKINQAQKLNLLSPMAASAAFRVNVPRIKRAHPSGHGQRRKAVVMRVQEIVEDCIAVLCAWR
jgi:hypothetical protein